jgi:hypothetical protein
MPAAPEPEQAPAEPKREAPKPARTRQPKAKAKSVQRTPAELLAAARTITVDWKDAAINAEVLRKELHCGSAPARQVRDALLAERADGRALHPVDTTDAPVSGAGIEGVAA